MLCILFFTSCICNDKYQKVYLQNNVQTLKISIHYIYNNEYGNIYLGQSDMPYYLNKTKLDIVNLFPPLGIIVVDNQSKKSIYIPDFHSEKWKIEVTPNNSNESYYLPLIDIWNGIRFDETKCIEILPFESIRFLFGSKQLKPFNFMYYWLRMNKNQAKIKVLLSLDDDTMIMSNELDISNYK